MSVLEAVSGDRLDSPVAGPSTLKTSPPCAQCHIAPSKYTCPRCAIRTCSATCVRAHKASTGCSGERDPVAYVPLSQYGYGALVNDYTFLEEVGRKVDGWSRAIAKEGLNAYANASSFNNNARGGRTMRGGRVRGRGRKFGHGHDRKQFLAMQLGFRDVDMDVLPSGMERAKRNQSYWDSKKRTAIITLELILHPPTYLLSHTKSSPTSLIVGKIDWDQPIRQIVLSAFRNTGKAKRNDALLNWLGLEEDESLPTSVLCIMKKPKDSDEVINSNSDTRPSYYKLNWNSKLSEGLRHKQFVEFPTLLLVDESVFDGVLIDDDGLEEDHHERRAKRRKLNPEAAKKAITGLLGSYGSEVDDTEDESNALNDLDEYTDDDKSEENGEEDEEECDENEQFLEHGSLPAASTHAEIGYTDTVDDEILDWGDEELAEDEAQLASLTAAVQQRFPS